ncbi:RNA polymerase sigma factor [Sphingobacterium thalpophilum]|uniref:Sigma-K factor n=1 Tax=Sphingobacterium thalpophilum TaxID=259 RepID=A0A4U9UNE7_9SPHI|nr:sigma-70 family RNA polymerase sigma factor [Sphingobacterium thalpophilum]VTR34367.1 Sigma-K factor [Sphingobacterium thalpophilum]
METDLSLNARKFEEYFDRWSPKVYQYALHKTRSSYLAEETVQRVFIKLWHNMCHKNVEASIESQLFCITRTTVIDLVKAEYHRNKLLQCQPAPILQYSPQEDYQAKQLASGLQQIVETLPYRRRQIFMLSRFSQLSHKEIAQKLSISTKTVENQLALALKTIRKALFIGILMLTNL